MGDLKLYRVWPDGTVQSTEESPYSWMSDDYIVVMATDEEAAFRQLETNLGSV